MRRDGLPAHRVQAGLKAPRQFGWNFLRACGAVTGADRRRWRIWNGVPPAASTAEYDGGGREGDALANAGGGAGGRGVLLLPACLPTAAGDGTVSLNFVERFGHGVAQAGGAENCWLLAAQEAGGCEATAVGSPKRRDRSGVERCAKGPWRACRPLAACQLLDAQLQGGDTHRLQPGNQEPPRDAMTGSEGLQAGWNCRCQSGCAGDVCGDRGRRIRRRQAAGLRPERSNYLPFLNAGS